MYELHALYDATSERIWIGDVTACYIRHAERSWWYGRSL